MFTANSQSTVSLSGRNWIKNECCGVFVRMLLDWSIQARHRFTLFKISTSSLCCSRCPTGKITSPCFTETKPQINFYPIGVYCVCPSCKSQTSLGVLLPASSVFLTYVSSQLPPPFPAAFSFIVQRLPVTHPATCVTFWGAFSLWPGLTRVTNFLLAPPLAGDHSAPPLRGRTGTMEIRLTTHIWIENFSRQIICSSLERGHLCNRQRKLSKCKLNMHVLEKRAPI